MLVAVILIGVMATLGGICAPYALLRLQRLEMDLATEAVEKLFDGDDETEAELSSLAAELAEGRRAVNRACLTAACVDVNRIAIIESGDDPNAVGKAGERGCCQIAEPTWGQCTMRMKRPEWTFDSAFSPGVNRAVANYYVNVRIPQLLLSCDIPDTVAARLVAYNWGIGNLARHWDCYANLTCLPAGVERYVRRYNEVARTMRQNR